MQVFDVKELAEYLKCSESSVRMLVREKKIAFFRIGSKINFTKEAIDNWVEMQQNNSIIKYNENKIRGLNNESNNKKTRFYGNEPQ